MLHASTYKVDLVSSLSLLVIAKSLSTHSLKTILSMRNHRTLREFALWRLSHTNFECLPKNCKKPRLKASRTIALDMRIALSGKHLDGGMQRVHEPAA
jgi:hypothetical protein